MCALYQQFCPGLNGLTHWGPDKMAAIFRTTFSSGFPCMEMYELRLKFHWSLFRKGSINNIPALVQIMAWRRPGDKLLSEPMMVSSSTHICVTRPQWVNTLRPRQNGHHFAEDVFKCIFLKKNVWISLKISLKFVPKVRINTIPALV